MRGMSMVRSQAVLLVAVGISVLGSSPGASQPRARLKVPPALKLSPTRTFPFQGKTVTAAELAAKLDPATPIQLPSGAAITVQQYVDRLGRAERELARRKQSLRDLSARTTVTPVALARSSSQSAQVRVKDEPLTLTPSACTPETCVPTPPSLEASWSATRGETDWVAFASTLALREATPTASSVSCSVTWTADLYLLNSKYSLVAFTSASEARMGASPTSSAADTLSVLGVHLEPGAGGAYSLGANPIVRVPVSIPLAWWLSVKGEFRVDGQLSLRPGASATAQEYKAVCEAAIVPRLSVRLDAHAGLSVGLGDLVELIEGGIGGELTPIDMSFPTVIASRQTWLPRGPGAGAPAALRVLKGHATASSDLQAHFMRGRIYAYYELPSILGVCVSELFDIPCHHEYDIVTYPGYDYSVQLFEPGIDLDLTYQKR